MPFGIEYSVVVKNIGQVYRGQNINDARQCFTSYSRRFIEEFNSRFSSSEYNPDAHVALFTDNDVVKEFSIQDYIIEKSTKRVKRLERELDREKRVLEKWEKEFSQGEN
jgi:hypothetical protein